MTISKVRSWTFGWSGEEQGSGQMELEDRERKLMSLYNVQKHWGWRYEFEVVLTHMVVVHVGQLGSFQFLFPNTYINLLVSQLFMLIFVSNQLPVASLSHSGPQFLLSFLGQPKFLLLAFPAFKSLPGTLNSQEPCPGGVTRLPLSSHPIPKARLVLFSAVESFFTFLNLCGFLQKNGVRSPAWWEAPPTSA